MSLIGIFVALILANLAAWTVGLHIAGAFPVLLSLMTLAYVLGLKHALDADHIAAIDNVTRRLIANGRRPAAVGLFFSLGHSTVVTLAVVGTALMASRFHSGLLHARDLLAPVATVFSSGFLLLVAGLNLVVLLQLWRQFRRERGGERGNDERASIGFFAGRVGGLLRWVDRSWLMFPLGFVFALGFDTATEVSLLGLAAAQAAQGLPLEVILVFPALFAAGMALADTLEGWLMLGAYRWSSRRPGARLSYNFAVTAVSVAVGFAIAAVQLAGLAPVASAWSRLGSLLQAHSPWVGGFIVLFFTCAWAGWALIDCLHGGRKLDCIADLRSR